MYAASPQATASSVGSSLQALRPSKFFRLPQPAALMRNLDKYGTENTARCFPSVLRKVGVDDEPPVASAY